MNAVLSRLFIAGMLLVALPAALPAQTMYVTDDLEITLRTGPSIGHKIISFPKSGQRIEVIQSGEEWSHVRLPNGTDGWVYTRYLSSELPIRIRLERLEARHKNLTDQANALAEENKALKAENQKLTQGLNETEKDFSRLRGEHETLKTESSDFLALKSKYEKTAAQLTEKSDLAKGLEEQVAAYERSHLIRWFLAGAGVLFFGFIIGFSVKRQRRRSSLL